MKRRTFTRARYLEGRRMVIFRICVAASDADAGTYSGQIVTSGPEGLSPFLFGLLIAPLAAFGLLLYRAGKEHKGKHSDQSLKVALTAIFKSFQFWARDGHLDPSPQRWRWSLSTPEILPGAPTLFAPAGTVFSAAGLGSLIASVRKGSYAIPLGDSGASARRPTLG